MVSEKFRKKEPSSPRSVLGKFSVYLLVFLSVVIIVGLFLKSKYDISAAQYLAVVAGGPTTAFGALFVGYLLYTRWFDDYNSRKDSESTRISFEARQSRAEDRGNRRTALGARMTQAVDHLDRESRLAQAAGIVELAALADDWWSLGDEALKDSSTYESFNDSDSSSTIAADPDDVDIQHALFSVQDNASVISERKRRRQEIVDLIYKHRFFSSSGQELKEEEAVLAGEDFALVQETRSRVISSRIEGIDEDNPEDSWAYLDFTGAELQRCQLPKKNLDGVMFNRTNLENANLFGSSLKDANLQFACLDSASLGDCNLDGIDLRGATLNNTHFGSCRFGSTKLAGFHFRGSFLSSVKWENADFDEAVFESVELRNINLSEMNVKHAKFSACKLVGMRSIESRSREGLKGASFFGCHFEETTFENFALRGVVFDPKTLLDNVTLKNVDVIGGTLEGISVKDIDFIGGSVQGSLRGTGFFGAKFLGVDLSEAELDDFYPGIPCFDEGTTFPDGYDPLDHGFDEL